MEVIFLAATCFAAVASTGFVIHYGWRLRWEETGVGRGVMASAVAASMLSWLYAVNRLDELRPGSWTHITVPLRIVAWLLMGGVYVWKCQIIRRNEAEHEAGTDRGGDA